MTAEFITSFFVPNFNVATVIGVVLSILAIVAAVLDIIFIPPPFKGAVTKFSLYVLALGLILIFVPSFFEDLFSTTEGTLIFIGVMVLLFLSYTLLLRGKKTKWTF